MGNKQRPITRCGPALLAVVVCVVMQSCSYEQPSQDQDRAGDAQPAPQTTGGASAPQDWQATSDDVADVETCKKLEAPLVRPIAPLYRDEGVAMLTANSIRELSDKEAARLIGIAYSGAKPLATSLATSFIGELRKRKYRAEVERRDSWTLADQDTLQALDAEFSDGVGHNYRPYLVRALAKGDRQPAIVADVCGRALRVGAVYPAHSATTT